MANTLITDVYTPEVVVSTIADGLLLSTAKMVGTVGRVLADVELMYGRGGSSVSWISSSLSGSAPISLDGTSGYEVGTAQTPYKATMTDVVKDLVRMNYPISFNLFAVDEAIKTGNFEVVQNSLAQVMRVWSTALDKYAISVAVAASTAAGNDKYFAKSGLDINAAFTETLYGSTFSDRQEEVGYIVVNAALANKIISENQKASEFGSAVLQDGKLTRYLGLEVIVTDNMTDKTITVSSASKSCYVACLAFPGAIELAVKPMMIRKIEQMGFNDVYDTGCSWAGYAPLNAGITPITCVYIEK